MISVALLPGDGVGPEVLAGPSGVLHELAKLGIVGVTGPWPVGASAFGALGNGLPPKTLAACQAADAIFFGAAGEHPGVPVAAYRPEHSLLALREAFELRVSIREVWHPTRRPMTVVRNLLGGAYGTAGMRTEGDGTIPARDIIELTRDQIVELTTIACELAAREPGCRVVSVDKANLFATSRLWRRTVTEVASARNVAVDHVLVDRFAFELGHGEIPEAVVLTEGIFGDILSDLACGRVGSIALCGSASVNPGSPVNGRCVGLFEPVHGSAPRRAGQDKANPAGAYLALAALLEWFAETASYGPLVRQALGDALAQGPLTYDLAGPGQAVASTREFAADVNNRFSLAAIPTPITTRPATRSPHGPPRRCDDRNAR